MVHFTCDQCGRELSKGEDHYIVKIEVFAAHDPTELTEEDFEEDHMEAVSQLLQELEDDGALEVEPASKHFRYDLCDDCRKKFSRDPLNKDTAQKFDFSEN
jgi:hypothetical protein